MKYVCYPRPVPGKSFRIERERYAYDSRLLLTGCELT